MIKTVKLATYELRRFKGPLPIVALLFLLLVPTLYGALYLWSNWDPYGKLDQVPVAVVNQDVPVEVNGKTVDAGNRLVAELQPTRSSTGSSSTRSKPPRGWRRASTTW